MTKEVHYDGWLWLYMTVYTPYTYLWKTIAKLNPRKSFTQIKRCWLRFIQTRSTTVFFDSKKTNHFLYFPKPRYNTISIHLGIMRFVSSSYSDRTIGTFTSVGQGWMSFGSCPKIVRIFWSSTLSNWRMYGLSISLQINMSEALTISVID